MLSRRSSLRLLFGAVLILAAGLPPVLGQEKKEAEKKQPEKKSGTVTGVVTAKGDPAKRENWIEVKADGEEKARRYVPLWMGGAPAQGGGPDKKILAEMAKVEVGSRVQLEWKFEERPRVIKIEVLKAPKKDK